MHIPHALAQQKQENTHMRFKNQDRTHICTRFGSTKQIIVA